VLKPKVTLYQYEVYTCPCGETFELDFEYDDGQPEGYRADFCPGCNHCVHEDGSHCSEPPVAVTG
jgi:hypothetical protein